MELDTVGRLCAVCGMEVKQVQVRTVSEDDGSEKVETYLACPGGCPTGHTGSKAAQSDPA